MSDYISRADAIKAVKEICWNCSNTFCHNLINELSALPSADAVDRTDFINWLTEVIMDEERWELNAVAYGEIICRKLVKLGVLEVTEEPSYYIRHIENNTKPSDLVYRPSADAEPKWNCTASFVAEQLDLLRKMTDEEKWEFFKRFFEIKGGDTE